MESITALLYCYRLPDISASDFRTYCENIHVPLVKSLLGDDHPLSHIRYYTNKERGYAIGNPAATDPDLIAVITYENEQALQRSMSKRRSDGIREQIETDEAKFMDRSKVRLVVLGKDDIGKTGRNV